MSRSYCAGLAAALASLVLAFAPGADAADRPAVFVDLSVLDALDGPTGPGWVPPLPGHRPPAPPIRPRRVLASPAAAPEPASEATPAARPTGAGRLAPAIPVPGVSTQPVLWQRPIPVTAGADLLQQVGARSTAPTPTPSEKLVGANVDVEATADTISALPNGDGFRILFSDDRTALSETGERLLDTLAERMSDQTELRLSVQAYAGGSPETAARARLLSLERALAVRNYLFHRGVRGSRIDVRALGNTSIEGPPERVDLLLVN